MHYRSSSLHIFSFFRILIPWYGMISMNPRSLNMNSSSQHSCFVMENVEHSFPNTFGNLIIFDPRGLSSSFSRLRAVL